MKAVVDKITGDTATILLGSQEFKVDVPVILLPKGTKEGTWLSIQIEIDEKETKSKYESNKSLLEKIKKKNK